MVILSSGLKQKTNWTSLEHKLAVYHQPLIRMSTPSLFYTYIIFNTTLRHQNCLVNANDSDSCDCTPLHVSKHLKNNFQQELSQVLATHTLLPHTGIRFQQSSLPV